MIFFQESSQRSWIASLGKKKKKEKEKRKKKSSCGSSLYEIQCRSRWHRLRGPAPRFERNLKIDRSWFRGETPLKARLERCSSLLRLEFLRDRRPCTAAPRCGRCNLDDRWVLFFLPAPAIPTVSSSFFAGVHRFSSRAPVRPLEQLTTGQPWPTDCTQNPGIRHETYRSELWSELHAYFGFDEIVRTNSSTLR